MAMPVTSFNIDKQMDDKLEELKEHFGASSKAEVIRKAVALLNVAKEAEQGDGTLVIKKNGEEVKVLVK
jgi:Arc/MetJ-type ribon-helix-helix transcriptional regulator